MNKLFSTLLGLGISAIALMFFNVTASQAKADWDAANAAGNEVGKRAASQAANEARDKMRSFGYGWVADTLGADNGVSAANIGGYIVGISSALGSKEGYSAGGVKPSFLQSILDGFKSSSSSAYTGQTPVTVSGPAGTVTVGTKPPANTGSALAQIGLDTVSNASTGIGSLLAQLPRFVPTILFIIGLSLVAKMFKFNFKVGGAR
jgi:hypothetical protein